jgi:CheY-like chemotaxis protein
LAQAQKMEALGQLTGGVAHDFNNLLMVVSGQAQLLRRRIGDDPKAVKALDAIELSTRRGEDLTRHLLSFAKRQRLQPVPVSLRDRAQGLQELLSASLSSAIQVVVDFPAKLWPVQVDLSELELSLLNLTVNARDAMPNGGSLTITAENVSLDESGDGALTGDFVALKVADTGAGIPPDILPKIFDPFFTTKEVSKGTGLGLSQVYGFSQQSGGRVHAESQLGRGTSFTLYLPRTRAAPKASEAAEVVETASGASVLLVEDNPEVAEVAAGMLEQLGHTVRVVSNAQAAMSALGEEQHPDVVFSDIVMAGEMDGVDLARRLKTEAPQVPVLLATGYSQAAERIGDEFPILRKPYKLADLSQALTAVLAKAQSTDGKLVRIDAARRARAARQQDRAS